MMKTRVAVMVIACLAAFAASAAGPGKPKRPAAQQAPSKAAQAAAAQAMFKRGFDAYVAFDCAAALILFRQGLQKSNDARAWYYVGNCERWRGEREASDAAYANGLKHAESGSDIQARLTSARASLPAAWDPRLQTSIFYEAVRKAGIGLLPSGYSINVDPRLFPVHPEHAFHATLHSNQAGPDSKGFRYYADVIGPGVYSWIADSRYDRKLRKYTKGEKLTDANGWEFTRSGLLFVGNVVAQPDRGWASGYVKHEQVVEFGVGVAENPNYLTQEVRCQLGAAFSDSTHFRPDQPTLLARCIHKSNQLGGVYTDHTDTPLPWHLANWKTEDSKTQWRR